MKNLFFTAILMAICYLLPQQLVAQTHLKTTTATVKFGKWTDCERTGGICTFNTTTGGKKNSTTQVQFNAVNNELILTFTKNSLQQQNNLNVLKNKLEKGYHLYAFTEDYIVPKNIKEALSITNVTKIKKGNYLIKEVEGQFIMKLKLE